MSQLEKKFEELVEIVSKLRSPEGCPWDIEQTSKSLIPYFIEEVYEVIEAIDDDDQNALKEELGDVMLHLIFQGLIDEEKKKFKVGIVGAGIQGVCNALFLQKKGHEVTIFDKDEPGSPAASVSYTHLTLPTKA